MIVGLENLKEEIKNKKLRDFALAIVKYQNFKTNVALPKINYDCSDNTKHSYFNCGISYLKTGVIQKGIPSKLYEYIDEFKKQCVQPLTPSRLEKRRDFKPRKNRAAGLSAIPPVARLDIVKRQLIEPFEYALKCNDLFLHCKSRDFAEGYLKALSDKGENTDNYKLVAITISDI